MRKCQKFQCKSPFLQIDLFWFFQEFCVSKFGKICLIWSLRCIKLFQRHWRLAKLQYDDDFQIYLTIFCQTFALVWNKIECWKHYFSLNLPYFRNKMSEKRKLNQFSAKNIDVKNLSRQKNSPHLKNKMCQKANWINFLSKL